MRSCYRCCDYILVGVVMYKIRCKNVIHYNKVKVKWNP